MTKQIVKIISLVAILTSFAYTNDNILLYKVENKNHNISAESIAKALQENGYIVAKNQDMNGPYKKQFGETTFRSYNLMSVYHPESAQTIVMNDNAAGIFVPFSIAVYQKNNDTNLHVALLSSMAQKKILKSNDTIFSKLEALNKQTMKKILPNSHLETLNYDALMTQDNFFTTYTLEIDDEEANDEYEDMLMMMQGNMKTAGFVVANYIDYNEELKDNDINDYMFFHSYSLCKLKVIYELSKKIPEAGAFAPCTMIIYHKKGSNKTVIVSLNINSLISILALKDEGILNMLNKTQSEMVAIIKDSTE